MGQDTEEAIKRMVNPETRVEYGTRHRGGNQKNGQSRDTGRIQDKTQRRQSKEWSIQRHG